MYWRYIGVFAFVFVLCMGFFLGFIPLPFAVLTQDMVERYKPIIYLHDVDYGKLEAIIVWAHFRPDITCLEFWYMWPYDGSEQRPDWEPVLVYISNGEIVAVAHRAHYQWRIKTTGIVKEETRPVIYFAPSYHTPFNGYPPGGYHRVEDYPYTIAEPPEKINPWEIYSITPQDIAYYTILSTTIAGTITILAYIISEKMKIKI